MFKLIHLGKGLTGKKQRLSYRLRALLDLLRILGKRYDAKKAKKRMTTINNVIPPRTNLPVNMNQQTATPNEKTMKITSKAFFTLHSLLT